MTVKDKVFLEHMMGLVDTKVEVATSCGKLIGKLAAVFPDHLLLIVDSGRVHVRLDKICFVRENPKKMKFPFNNDASPENL